MRYLLTFIVCLFCLPAEAEITFVSSASGSSVGSPCVTGAFDSTGGNFIIVADTRFTSAATTCSDNKGNTYTPLTEFNNSNTYTRLYYCADATVGTGHTVTMTGAGYHGTVAMAFAGVKTTSPLDTESAGGTATGTSVQPGSQTPTEDNCLLFTVLGIPNSITSEAINESFSTPYGVNGGAALGTFVSYKIQTTAAAQNPTWSWTTTRAVVSTMASFKAEAGGGGPAINPISSSIPGSSLDPIRTTIP